MESPALRMRSATMTRYLKFVSLESKRERHEARRLHPCVALSSACLGLVRGERQWMGSASCLWRACVACGRWWDVRADGSRRV